MLISLEEMSEQVGRPWKATGQINISDRAPVILQGTQGVFAANMVEEDLADPILDRSEANTRPPAAEPKVYLVQGREAVLRMQHVLIEFSADCDQSGAMQDLAYFLSKPGALRRIPYLLLVSHLPDLDLDYLNAKDVLGAVLLYGYRVLGFDIKAFTTNDRSGYGTVLAPAPLRSRVAVLANRALLEMGAHVVMISFRDNGVTDQEAKEGEWLAEVSHGANIASRWARRERDIPDYLPLESTFDATLANMGQRTRKNMRYYRRRAETQLGCTFCPAVEIDKAELLAFNRDCMFTVPDQIALWRYESLEGLSEPFLMGIKDKDGRWLSLLAGRRYQSRTEILWQMNRSGLQACSLSTVMRSYYIEHEISRGMKKMYIEGGTPHAVRHSMVKETLTDLVVLRSSPFAFVMQRLAKHFMGEDNELGQMLSGKSLNPQTWSVFLNGRAMPE